MKRLVMILGLLILLVAPAAILVGQTAAVDVFPNCGSGSATGSPDVCGAVGSQGGNDGTNNPVVKIITAAIDIISFVVGVAAVIGIIVSGIRMIVASGDANAVASARTGLIYSLIGVAIAALAQTIVVYVLDKIK